VLVVKGKQFIYRSELNDDFAGQKRKSLIIDNKYNYLHKGILWRVFSFVIYRIIATPIAYIYSKVRYGHRVVGKKLLKECKGTGCFVYGNHTMTGGDAIIPSIINVRMRTYTIVRSENLTIPYMRKVVELCGAIPLPNTKSATANFLAAIKYRIDENSQIMIYPEASIWPYYTGIRDFGSASFRYPVDLSVPTYCLTNTFHKRWILKTPKVITYIDGPFFVDKDLPRKQATVALRDMVYKTMCERSKLSSYSVNEYIKGE
jgi:1-acyl-sn-glycerol-3-phosphate acyltransferase